MFNLLEELELVKRDSELKSKKIKELETAVANYEEERKITEKVKRRLLLSRQLEFVSLEDMKLVKTLGKGCNGIVYLVEVSLKIYRCKSLKNLPRFPIILIGGIDTLKNSHIPVNPLDARLQRCYRYIARAIQIGRAHV